MSLAHLQCRTEQSLHIAAHRTATVQFRMPGGLSTPAQVTLLNRMDSPWVNGTAYPGDADVCQCLSAVALGRCAARLADGDGRIAILHDDKRLVAAKELLCAAPKAGEGKSTVTLSELLVSPRGGGSGRAGRASRALLLCTQGSSRGGVVAIVYPVLKEYTLAIPYQSSNLKTANNYMVRFTAFTPL